MTEISDVVERTVSCRAQRDFTTEGHLC